MPGHEIIVIGASAGGVEPLITLVRGLPAHLPAALFVVLHVPAERRSQLPAIFNRAGTLLALHPMGSAPIRHGCIYVAPPDHHLLIRPGVVMTHRGPRENGHRPAVDPLFRTAAHAYGPQVVGVVLSGTQDDGTLGLLAIKRHGGVAVVQDPDDTLYPQMPQSALRRVDVDYRLPVAELAPVLDRLASSPAATVGFVPVLAQDPAAVPRDAATPEAREDTERMQTQGDHAVPSVYSCPDCGGVLWEVKGEGAPSYRCRVGHAFTEDGVVDEQDAALERTLWVALKILEERVSLLRRVARRAERMGHERVVERKQADAAEAERQAARLRSLLERREADPTEAAAG